MVLRLPLCFHPFPCAFTSPCCCYPSSPLPSRLETFLVVLSVPRDVACPLRCYPSVVPRTDQITSSTPPFCLPVSCVCPPFLRLVTLSFGMSPRTWSSPPPGLTPSQVNSIPFKLTPSHSCCGAAYAFCIIRYRFYIRIEAHL